MTIAEITNAMEREKTAADKIVALKKMRAALLEELHAKQQLLDQVDYMIYNLKKENR